MQLTYAELETPVGTLNLAAGGTGLCALEFSTSASELRARMARRFGEVEFAASPALDPIIAALRAYFGGDLAALAPLAVDAGGTPFQRKVWARLREIPPGSTLSYAELARAIGRPTAFRAAAMANARNPVSIVVPCHRVIASDGGLGGYGGGIRNKRWLLEHEGAFPDRDLLA